jgi:isoleucyl-tRNA synthetase
MYKKVNNKQSFSELEKKILKFWQEDNTFQKSINERENEEEFVFYDGPPFATGLPHYGNILAGILKDVIPRYKTMNNYKVPRNFGWDCHGLPVENLIEKELKLKDKQAIEDLGIDKFNEACRSSVLRYVNEWEKIITRTGRWVDFKNDYKTMNPEYMESVWWVFKELWKQGLVYQGLKPMHICPRCVTPLSNFEVNLGYTDLTDISVTAKFKIKNLENTYFLAWTTTPWTLAGNMFLAVNSEIDYVFLSNSEETLVLAKSLVDNYKKELEGYEITKTIKGKEIVKMNLSYEALYDYYQDTKNAFKVVSADFVTTESGTGIVHIAPAFGEDDLNLGKKLGVEAIQHVKMNGCFEEGLAKNLNQKYPEFPLNYPVKDKVDNRRFDELIVKLLQKENKVFKSENLRHSYPTCWRCSTPLLNYATKSWFVSVEKIKEKLLTNNQKINWVPEHLKNGRFGKWLEGARDWAISRNRFWGAPLPIWENDLTGKQICIGSIEELEEKTGKKITDLHKHYVDNYIFKISGEDGIYKRIPEVFDCWFESGSMPYAQKHYPFTTKDIKIPANFIAEGLDQTRGWFYTLHILSTAIFNKPAFSNVIVNGIILAEDGKKMSKSLKNYPDPLEIMEEFGADALRFYLMNSPLINADDLRFSKNGVEEVLRNVLIPLWNSYSFLVTYAQADNWEYHKILENPPQLKTKNPLDIWMISEIENQKEIFTKELEAYKINKATELIPKLIDNLTNWYIRRSRRRFWAKNLSENKDDKNDAYLTLYYVIIEICKLLAPVCPFITEEIFLNLTNNNRSIHLQKWSKVNQEKIDKNLSEKISLTQKIVSLGLALRKQEEIRVKQPLQDLKLVCVKSEILNDQIETIKEELNIKEIIFLDNPEQIAEKQVKLNAKKLGPKFGKKIQELIKASKQGKVKELENGNFEIAGEIIEKDDLEIIYTGKEGENVVSDQGIVLSLNTNISPELEDEGIARDLVRIIQDLRRQADLEVSDYINLEINGIKSDILNKFKTYIESETLSIIKKVENPLKVFNKEELSIKICKN